MNIALAKWASRLVIVKWTQPMWPFCLGIVYKVRWFLAFSDTRVWAGKPVSPCQKLVTLSMEDERAFLSARGLDKGGDFFFLSYSLSGLIGGCCIIVKENVTCPPRKVQKRSYGFVCVLGLGSEWGSVYTRFMFPASARQPILVGPAYDNCNFSSVWTKDSLWAPPTCFRDGDLIWTRQRQPAAPALASRYNKIEKKKKGFPPSDPSSLSYYTVKCQLLFTFACSMLLPLCPHNHALRICVWALMNRGGRERYGPSSHLPSAHSCFETMGCSGECFAWGPG